MAAPNGGTTAGAAVGESAPRLIVSLSDAECRLILARQRLCIVSVVDGEEKYAVPVFYGFDGDALYLGVAEGRKTRVLDANARVYILVTEVGPGDAWRSVSVAPSSDASTGGLSVCPTARRANASSE